MGTGKTALPLLFLRELLCRDRCHFILGAAGPEGGKLLDPDPTGCQSQGCLVFRLSLPFASQEITLRQISEEPSAFRFHIGTQQEQPGETVLPGHTVVLGLPLWLVLAGHGKGRQAASHIQLWCLAKRQTTMLLQQMPMRLAVLPGGLPGGDSSAGGQKGPAPKHLHPIIQPEVHLRVTRGSWRWG